MVEIDNSHGTGIESRILATGGIYSGEGWEGDGKL
jgi:hypothetical protein